MIKDFEDKTTSEVIMIFKKSQDVDYSKLPKYDLIFTSPPYFDLEKYEGMEIFKNKDEFIEKYWRPTIEKAYKYLEKGGHLALNMPEEMYIALKPMIGSADPVRLKCRYKIDLIIRETLLNLNIFMCGKKCLVVVVVNIK
jgi:tRNA G10  N-methylase Trm11